MTEVLPWIVAVAGMAVAAVFAHAEPAGGLDECQRHLMRCRRRGEPAWVLLAHFRRSPGVRADDLVACLRLTDSASARRTRAGHELLAVFDGEGLDRGALERRLRASAPVAATGWARFPDDGVTLEALRERAVAARKP